MAKLWRSVIMVRIFESMGCDADELVSIDASVGGNRPGIENI